MKSIVNAAISLTVLSLCVNAPAWAGYTKEGLHKADTSVKGVVHKGDSGVKKGVRVSGDGVKKGMHETHKFVKKVL